ncbi:hypothetical protein PCANC_28578 [Puccinia coronata f. sp. avenae]|uniref:Uncharacterized protein n=1 Tax=Puccinia coronata f. sp. avenae TaxID=200324 RepID=A0A2N5TDN9_9BASI|nr:hypothetical protein PCANC_28578 [Puccinia coronata f. sp. avenae]
MGAHLRNGKDLSFEQQAAAAARNQQRAKQQHRKQQQNTQLGVFATKDANNAAVEQQHRASQATPQLPSTKGAVPVGSSAPKQLNAAFQPTANGRKDSRSA